jgi:hypothetical protein
MGIDARDWDTFMRHALDTLQHFGVGERETAEVLGFLATLSTEIVETLPAERAASF